MWGVVKGFQIACNFTGPLGDLTGTGDQPSGKGVPRKGTQEVLETPKRHLFARTRTNREGHTGVFFLVNRRTLGDLTGTGDQPSGKVVLETRQRDNQHRVRTIRGAFCLVNRVSLKSTLHYRM